MCMRVRVRVRERVRVRVRERVRVSVRVRVRVYRSNLTISIGSFRRIPDKFPEDKTHTEYNHTE